MPRSRQTSAEIVPDIQPNDDRYRDADLSTDSPPFCVRRSSTAPSKLLALRTVDRKRKPLPPVHGCVFGERFESEPFDEASMKEPSSAFQK